MQKSLSLPRNLSLNTTTFHSAIMQGDKHRVIKIKNEQLMDVNIVDRWERTPLFLAVLTNNKDIVEYLLKSKAKVDVLDAHQKSLIHVAVHKGQHGCLKLLLQAFEKIYNARDIEEGPFAFPFTDLLGISPLHIASKLPSSKCLNLILKYPFLSNADCQDHEKRTPLHWAAAHDAEENIQTLLKFGADPSITDDQERLPLHWAALSLEEGSKECLQTLLDSLPLQVNKPDSYQATPLHLAVVSNNKEKVEMLLSNKRCQVNATDKQKHTPLHYACKSDMLSIAKCLISHGADINKRDMYGATPLHYAALHNRVSIVELLLQQPELKDVATNEGETPLHWAAQAGSNSSLIHLVNHGGSLKRKNANGETPLHVAAQQNNNFTSTVEVLLKLNASVTSRTNEDSIPLHYAAREGNSKIVKQLLEADPTSLRLEDCLGRNALHHAVIGGYLHLSQILIETGIPSDCCDAFGMHSLHLAACLGSSDVVHLLLENKAQINSQDNEGMTSLHRACQEGHLNCVNTLLEYKAYPNCMDGTRERLTPLDYALKSNNKEMIRSLKAAGAHTSTWIRNLAARCIQKKWREYSWSRRYKQANRAQEFLAATWMTDTERPRNHPQECYNKNLFQCSGASKYLFRKDDNKPVRNDKATFPVLNPLLTPFLPESENSVNWECEAGNRDYKEYGHNGTKPKPKGHRLHDSNSSSYCHGLQRTGRLVTNEAMGITVRLPEGEELTAACNAWRQRLGGLTVTRIRAQSADPK